MISEVLDPGQSAVRAHDKSQCIIDNNNYWDMRVPAEGGYLSQLQEFGTEWANPRGSPGAPMHAPCRGASRRSPNISTPRRTQGCSSRPRTLQRPPQRRRRRGSRVSGAGAGRLGTCGIPGDLGWGRASSFPELRSGGAKEEGGVGGRSDPGCAPAPRGNFALFSALLSWFGGSALL